MVWTLCLIGVPKAPALGPGDRTVASTCFRSLPNGQPRSRLPNSRKGDPFRRFGLPSRPGVVRIVLAPGSASGKHPFYVVCVCVAVFVVCGGCGVGVGVWGCGPLMMLCVRALFVGGGGCVWVKVKVKCSGALPNSSVTVIPTCPSQHPFRLAGSQPPLRLGHCVPTPPGFEPSTSSSDVTCMTAELRDLLWLCVGGLPAWWV